MPQILFISDLHVSENEPAITALLQRFVQEISAGTEALYILGDLFEQWIGDDDIDTPFSHEIIKTLTQVAQRGISLYFMHGNRDFLLGDAFCNACGGQLLNDPTMIDLYGTRTLLMHGDSLCIDDTAYMDFRAMVRQPAWQKNFLAKPLLERQTIAAELRTKSKEATRLKPTDITDVAIPAIETILRQYNYPALIHGHTHRPAKHAHLVDRHMCDRWVLPDWYDGKGGYLKVSPEKWEIIRLP